MPVGVVVDSTAALSEETAERWGIQTVPILLTVNGRNVHEGQLDTAEVLGARQYSTSTPPPGSFAKSMEMVDDGDGVIVVTVSSTLSGTHRAAQLAVDRHAGQAAMLDSRTAAGGQALVAVAAARAAAEGATLDSVVATAGDVARRVHLIGALANLDQLIRSGRVPGLAGRAGNLLGLRPMFDIRDGAIGRLRPARSDTAARERILEAWRRTRPAGGDAGLHVVGLHAEVPQEAERLLAEVRAEVRPVEEFVSGFGQAMMANSGVGVRGLAWYWD